MMKLKTWWWPFGLLVVLGVLGRMFPDRVLTLFSRPAGTLAAWMLSLPYVFDATRGLVIDHVSGEVLVNGACSGFGFFTVLLVLAFSRSVTTGWRVLPLAVGCYLFTLLVNACRVVLAVHAQSWVIRFAHPDLLHAVHLTVGVAVFLPALLLLFTIMERNMPHVLLNT